MGNQQAHTACLFFEERPTRPAAALHWSCCCTEALQFFIVGGTVSGWQMGDS